MPTPEVLLEHRRFMLALARSLLHDEHAAEDVVQDATVAALTKPPRPGNLRAWLGKVTRHLALTRRRGETRRERRERAAGRAGTAPATADSVARLELQRRVVGYVLALDEPYREVIVHRFFDDLPLREIARRLDVPLETVRTRLRRALAQLRGRLDADHAGDRRAWSLALLPLLAAPARAGLLASVKGGALVMAGKLKIAAVVVVLGLVAWLVAQEWRGEAKPERVAARGDEPAPPPPLVPGVQYEAPKADGVDFAALDRDRDLHGTVVDETGAPVAGARVQAVRMPWLAFGPLTPAALVERPGPETRTAADGTFALRLRRGEQAHVRVFAEGLPPLERRGCLAGGRERIVLREGRTLEVQVLDAARRPAAGAHVLLLKHPEALDVEAAGQYEWIDGTADRDGRVRFEGLIGTLPRAVGAWGADGGIATRPLAPVDERVELVLISTRTIRGRVTDAETGAPVAGARVAPASDMHVVKTLDVVWATTNDRGEYEYALWAGPALGDRVLGVVADGYVKAAREVGKDTVVDFSLSRGAAATGRLLDADGRPVTEAVVVAKAGPGAATSAHPGPDGRFALTGVPPGARQVGVVAPGHAMQVMPFRAGDLGDIRLAEGLRLEGVVRKAEGTPVPGVVVDFGGKGARCRTDDLGRFRYADLPAGVEARLRATLADGRTIQRKVKAGALDVVLVADEPDVVVVHVVDAAGRPVEGAVVLVRESERPVEQATDAAGRARLPTSGRRQLWIAVVSGRDDLLDVDLGFRVIDDGEVRVVLPEARRITGVVVDESGDPCGGVTLCVKGAAPLVSPETNRDGTFAVKTAVGATVDLWLQGDPRGGSTTLVGRVDGVAAGTHGVVIRAREVAVDRTLRVRVVNPDGHGMPGVLLTVPVVAYRKNLTPTDEGGRIELVGLPAAPFDLGVDARAAWEVRDRWAPPRTLRITPEGQEVVLRFRATVTIEGTVVGPDGKPRMRGVEAWRGDLLVGSDSADAAGTFRILVAADEPEPVRLLVRAVPSDPLAGSVEGVAPGTKDVAIRLRTER